MYYNTEALQTSNDFRAKEYALTLIYPDIIGEYYNIYLKELKSDVKKFIKE